MILLSQLAVGKISFILWEKANILYMSSVRSTWFRDYIWSLLNSRTISQWHCLPHYGFQGPIISCIIKTPRRQSNPNSGTEAKQQGSISGCYSELKFIHQRTPTTLNLQFSIFPNTETWEGSTANFISNGWAAGMRITLDSYSS